MAIGGPGSTNGQQPPGNVNNNPDESPSGEQSSSPVRQASVTTQIPSTERGYQHLPQLGDRSAEIISPSNHLGSSGQLQQLNQCAEYMQGQINKTGGMINYGIGQVNFINNLVNNNNQNPGFAMAYAGGNHATPVTAFPMQSGCPPSIQGGLLQQINALPSGFGMGALPAIRQQLSIACGQMLQCLSNIDYLMSQYSALGQQCPIQSFQTTPLVFPLNTVIQNISCMASPGMSSPQLMAYPHNNSAWDMGAGQYFFVPPFHAQFDPDWLFGQCPNFGVAPLTAMPGWNAFCNAFSGFNCAGGGFGPPPPGGRFVAIPDYKKDGLPPNKPEENPADNNKPVKNRPVSDSAEFEDKPSKRKNVIGQGFTGGSIAGVQGGVLEGLAGLAPQLYEDSGDVDPDIDPDIDPDTGDLPPADQAQDFYDYLGIGDTHSNPLIDAMSGVQASDAAEPLNPANTVENAQGFYDHLGIGDTHSNPLIDAMSGNGSSESLPSDSFATDDSLWQMGFDLSNLTDLETAATTLGADAGASVLEGTLVAAMAQKKLYTVKKRRENIIKSHKIREAWQAKAGGKSFSAIEHRKLTKSEFKDLSRLCFLSDEFDSKAGREEDKDLKNILKHGDCYVSGNEIESILTSLHGVVDGLPELAYDKSQHNTSKQQIKDLNKVLKQVGIEIEYRTDKIFGKIRKGAKPFCHKIKIDKEKLYKVLENQGQVPTTEAVTSILDNHSDDIDALYNLKDYDKWKIHQHKKDRDLKLASAVIGVIPLPADEIMRSAAYGKEAVYRKSNRETMEGRIDESMGILESNQQYLGSIGWNQKEIAELYKALDNARNLKKTHIGIKRKGNIANSTIHGVAAATSIPAKFLGPVGSGIQAGAKAAAKISTAIGTSADRYRKDKKLIAENKFVGVKNIYLRYKHLYLGADSEDKRKSIIDLVDATFGIKEEAFKTLVKTKLVESNRFKLSFSHKVK